MAIIALTGVACGAAPALTPVTSEGLLERVREFRGRKAVVVHVWATWCAPCVKEFPEFVRMAQARADRIAVIFVSADFPKDADRVREFLAAQGVTRESYIKSESDQKFISALSDQWTGALPATFVFDTSGALVAFAEEALPEGGVSQYIEEVLNP